jgi:riboflavin-specific deaminase-like protein
VNRPASKTTPTPRPFVFINMAMTADGKIAPASRRFVPFGSHRDQEHLYELRAEADAVMAGARTVDLCCTTLGPGGKRFRELRLRRGLAEYNLRIVVSGSASLSPRAAIFRRRFSPLIVLTSEKASPGRRAVLREHGAEVVAFGQKEVDLAAALRWLRAEHGVKRLLCEGGGELNAALFRAGLVDELHVTLCPLVLGGRGSPTIADGAGFPTLAKAAPLQKVSARRVGDELFLVFRAAGASRQWAPRQPAQPARAPFPLPFCAQRV